MGPRIRASTYEKGVTSFYWHVRWDALFLLTEIPLRDVCERAGHRRLYQDSEWMTMWTAVTTSRIDSGSMITCKVTYEEMVSMGERYTT